MPCLCNSFVYSTIQWVCQLLWNIYPHEAADKDEHLAAMQTLKADQWPHERDSTVYFGIIMYNTYIIQYICLKLSECIMKQNLLALWPRFHKQWLGHTWTLDTWDRWVIPGRERCDATGGCDCPETSRRGTPRQHSEKEWKAPNRWWTFASNLDSKKRKPWKMMDRLWQIDVYKPYNRSTGLWLWSNQNSEADEKEKRSSKRLEQLQAANKDLEDQLRKTQEEARSASVSVLAKLQTENWSGKKNKMPESQSVCSSVIK